MWKIVFSYQDGSRLEIKGRQKVLPHRLAVKYRNEKRSAQNDGGMVYHPPFRTSIPEPLQNYIERMEANERKSDKM